MKTIILNNKKPNFKKLEKFGFTKQNDCYVFKTYICNNQFKMFVSIYNDGKIATKLLEIETNEEYVLHLTDASGAFVTEIRSQYQNVLNDVINTCFENDVFKLTQSLDVIEYVKNKYDDELEYLWQKFPNNAIWRRKDNKKWYGLMATLSKNKLGLNSTQTAEVLIIRTDETTKKIIDNQTIFVGYHMNKNNWITLLLNGNLQNELVFDLIDKSFELAKIR